MNKNFIIYLSLFISFIFCYSCNNELNELHETDKNTGEIKFSIEDARSYFESNATDLSPMILSRNITKNIGSSTLDLKPAWENAIKSGHNNVLLIEIPLQTTTQPFAQCTQSKNGKIVYQRKMISARRLIISKTATGTIDMFIATVVPSQDDKSSYVKQLNEFSYLGGGCFTGQVFCSTLEGELVKIFNYEDGENIGALQFRLEDDLT